MTSATPLLFWLPIALVTLILTYLAISTWRHTAKIEARYPPIGRILTINGLRTHVVIMGDLTGRLTPVLFLHGASGNVRDGMLAFNDLADHCPIILVDRPGHGWSERHDRSDFATPDGQAAHIAKTLDSLGVERAHIVGHSYGAGVAAALAAYHGNLAASLTLISPASHPWPGGILWYYRLAAAPIIGWLVTGTITLPVGLRRIACASNAVFSPASPPADYAEKTGAALVLSPKRFQANARDIARLYGYVLRARPSYQSIEAKTMIITGDSDGVVWPSLHSYGLSRDIPNSDLTIFEHTGHMPHHQHNAAVRRLILNHIDDARLQVASCQRPNETQAPSALADSTEA